MDSNNDGCTLFKLRKGICLKFFGNKFWKRIFFGLFFFFFTEREDPRRISICSCDNIRRRSKRLCPTSGGPVDLPIVD
jgi:hypothetical protein